MARSTRTTRLNNRQQRPARTRARVYVTPAAPAAPTAPARARARRNPTPRARSAGASPSFNWKPYAAVAGVVTACIILIVAAFWLFQPNTSSVAAALNRQTDAIEKLLTKQPTNQAAVQQNVQKNTPAAGATPTCFPVDGHATVWSKEAGACVVRRTDVAHLEKWSPSKQDDEQCRGKPVGHKYTVTVTDPATKGVGVVTRVCGTRSN